MHTALKKITTEAKKIRRLHKSTSWKSAVKQAGAKYRAGKLGRVKKKSRVGTNKKKRRVGGFDTSRQNQTGERAGRNTSMRLQTLSRRRVGAVNKSHKDGIDRKRVDITVGSVSHHLSAAKKNLEKEIAAAHVNKLKATNAKQYHRAQKTIAEKTKLLRKISK